MPPHVMDALRARAASLPLEFVEGELGRFTGATLRQYRPMIQAAQVAADEAKAALHRWVAAARRAGMSWSEIGKLLGISKQAAQQRFGNGSGSPVPFGTIAVVPGTTADSEEELLAREGAAGRELVAVDALRLLFRQTDRAWQHRRSIGLRADAQDHGWQLAAEWHVFAYYKRAL